MWEYSKALAITTVVSRLIHLVIGTGLVMALYGRMDFVEAAEKYISGLQGARDCVDEEFCRENVFMVEGVSLLTFFDVSMLQFMPWKKSRFFVLSEGYPTMTMMKICMSVKTIQSLVSVTCETVFLVLNGKRSQGQAQALLGLNIASGILTVLMDILVLCLRGGILEVTENERAEAARKDAERRKNRGPQDGGTPVNHLSPIHSLSPSGNGPRKVPSGSKEVSVSLAEVVEEDIEAEGVGTMEMHDNHLRNPDEEQGQVEEEGEFEAEASEEQDTIAEGSHQESNNDSADIEIRHIYEASSTDIIPIHQNPMHDPEDEGVNDRNITTVQAQNTDLKSENAYLKSEYENIKENRADVVSQNRVLVSQNRVLQQRVQDLESQVKGYQEKDNEEEIKEFCEVNFNINFPITSIYDVKGDDAHEIFKWAKKNYGSSAVPKWNFHKILINKDGKIEETYSSFTKPMSNKITSKIESLL